MSNRIYLSLAQMGGEELKFVNEAFSTNWVVPLGPNVDAFEKDLEAYLGEGKRVVALSAGTAAIHLGLVMLGVTAGDEVICQSFTFAASANPVKYLGANPVFVDSENDTWNMSPALLEQAILDRKKITGRYPKAIVVVHLYGMPAKIDEILEIANRYNIPVLEDAAEAIGSTYKGRMCGTFGAYGVLSFNGNKTITTSGGGALICGTDEQAKRVMFFATQARENRPYYYHKEIGYNYRLSNVSAGIGRGQMLVLNHHVSRRRAIHELYTKLFANVDGITVKGNPGTDYDSNFWLSCIIIDPEKFGKTNDEVRLALEAENIESRLLWNPMHRHPVYENAPFYGNGVSDSLFAHGLCLPSGSSLTNDDIARVAAAVLACKK
ncbi:MAG: aminotransferase class I/II-fold pyridoxal phosphate-dependent enzyme [Muribaculaceae bacterium]|nr:aminotransferase class I/II-fold pyridoxal phosphate-dependent enzyme [Muribaculaceae bacterium]